LNDASASNIEKIQQLLSQEKVMLDREGRLLYGGGSLPRMGKNIFQWQDGGDYVAFGEDGTGRISHLFVKRTALMRVPWIETFPVQIGLLGFSLLIFVSALIAWLVASMKRQGKSYLVSGLLSLLNMGFLIGLGLLLTPVFAGSDPPWTFSFAPPFALLVLLALPLIGIVMLVMLAVQVFKSWKERRMGWFVRVHNTLILIAGFVYLYFLHTWNLLGYRL
jgi:hypothetical protein